VAAKSIPLDYRHLDIVAKTGTMDYVRGLAGYIATPSGRRLAFAIFSNDLDRRVPGVQRINRRWMARARVFERSLIRNWVLALEG
jgi:D-alanyl-D-alanine carboxypeptidase/D-alanyl-D-alanine-endopeptidase (penicillin-binding protein 4)